MKTLASFKIESILTMDGEKTLNVIEQNGIYTIAINDSKPDFDLDNYGCLTKADLINIATRNLRRATEKSRNEVINFIISLENLK